ncbi:MAG: VWA domain-containing protein [Gammaproteobacteria bacterium]|nr:VWA domain-containing protein [Gammaproteobacteria bacterium]
MLQLAWPWALAAVLLPLLAARLPPAPSWQTGALRVPFFQQVRAWPGRGDSSPRRWLLWVAAVAWLALVAAATRPQWVGEPVNLPLSGRDLMLAIDLSNSMDEPDLMLDGRRATRLTVVKQVAGDFIERRKGDRLGLVLFGTKPYLQVPLTFDRTVVRALLDEAAIGLAGSATALGDAIGLAVKRLRDRPSASRVLVLLTDGASNAGNLEPMQAARLASFHGLRIYTVGVGADAPEPRRVGGSAGPQGLHLDEAVLRGIAGIAGGRYFRARNTDQLVEIYALLDELEPVVSDSEQLRPVSELFHLPLALAMLLSGMVGAGMIARPHPLSRSFASAPRPRLTPD